MTATAQTTRALVEKARANGKATRMGDRETQQQKLYDAERVIFGAFNTNLTEKQVLALVKRVSTSAYVIRHYGKITPKVTFIKSSGRNCWADWTGGIHLRPWGLNTGTVLHEISHLYTMREGAGHGWLFCAVYLDLVRKFMGQDAHDALKASFRSHKVRFRCPQARRTLTPEQRQAAADRLAAARAKRAASTGEWVVGVQFRDRDGLRYIKSVGKRSMAVTKYPALALVRKTDTAALKLYNEVKRHVWRDETVVLVNRLTMEVRSAA